VFEQGRKIVSSWLDGLDRSLAAEAGRAGLSNHPTMIGDQRERALVQALREFLPPLVRVGTGKVFDSAGTMSPQTDIVIHDGRYPVFNQGNSALFPAEGVIATIEVKSRLDAASLEDAWNKCLSVLALNQLVAAEDRETMDCKLKAKGIAAEQRVVVIDRCIRPTTYIYAFDGLGTLDGFTDALQALMANPGVPVSQDTRHPVVPSIIASGGVVGLAWGNPVRAFPRPGQPDMPSGALPVYVSVPSQHRFGILAADLLARIEQRTTLAEAHFGIRRSIFEYLPVQEYLQRPIEEGPYCVTYLPPEAAPQPASIAPTCSQ
jgi:hypothetical protein